MNHIFQIGLYIRVFSNNKSKTTRMYIYIYLFTSPRIWRTKINRMKIIYRISHI